MEIYHDAAFIPLHRFLEYSNNKEPVFYIVTWCINRLTFANEFCYKFILSFFIYSFLNVAVYKFCKVVCRDFKLVLFAIVLMNFIPYIFISSMHLVRQYLAASLLMYIMIDKFFYNRNHYIYILFVPFIHSTSFFFIPFLFLTSLGKPFKESKLTYLIIIVSLLSIQAISSFMLKLSFVTGSIFTYALSKASVKSTFDLGAMTPFEIGFVILLLLMSVYVSAKFKTIENRQAVRRLFSIMCLLCLFILSVYEQSELAKRFLFYTYIFIPFLVVVMFQGIKMNMRGIYVMGSVFIILFWAYYLEAGQWTYIHSDDIWTASLFSYIL